MSAVPQILDETLIAERARRAAPFFLNAEFEAQLLDRLNDVTRNFENALVIGKKRWEIGDGRWEKIKKITFGSPLSPLPSPFYDLIISCWNLTAVNDVVGAITQIRDALKPDGWFLAAVYGGETLTELRQVLAEIDTEIFGAPTPRVVPMLDARDAATLLQRTRFALPVVDSDRVEVHYNNLFDLMRDIRKAGWANAMTDRMRRPLPKHYFTRAAELYAWKFPAPNGKICATAEVIYLSGWAPAASQQKPMIPGTATQRLADALAANSSIKWS